MNVKNNLFGPLCLLAALLNSYPATSGDRGKQAPTLASSQSILNGPNWVFRENKGQLMDENHKPLPVILYYGRQGGVTVYCRPGMLSFVFAKTENDEKVSEATGKPAMETGLLSPSKFKTPAAKPTTFSRAELVLLGANKGAEIEATDKQEYYENYYTTGDANRGIANVNTYKTITYKNIYPNIDMVLEAKPKGMEYSFMVRPGGKVADIQLQWNGLKNIKGLENGGMEFTGLRDKNQVAGENKLIVELAPYSYQTTNNGQPKTINSTFSRHTNRISFSVPIYDKTNTLVIDPMLDWGTYYGGSGADEGYGVSTDGSGNVYMTGITSSTAGIATTGAFQINFGGGFYDAFLAKFSSSGSIAWATYYGGSGDDYGYGVSTDGSGNIFITGSTTSTSGIATSGGYQTTYGGGTNEGDAFLAKFGSSGSLSWATYYGGSGDDGGNGVSADRLGNVYITGYTQSPSGIATSGAHQTSFRGGDTTTNPSGGDAFLAKFGSSGSLSWATYYGGNNDDQAFGVSTDSSGNVYITGYTSSGSGISSSLAYQTTYGGGNGDAFLAKFGSSGSLAWATYFGGSTNDGGNGVATDGTGNVFITGYTSSSSGIATPGAYKTAYADSGDAFLAKFGSSGSLSWATYYGGTGQEIGYGVSTDKSGNVYITGQTISSSGIATSGAYQTSYFGAGIGGFDAYLAKFGSSGNLAAATYYGVCAGTNVEGVATDGSGNVYITGQSEGAHGIATSGAYQTSNAGLVDADLAKFSFPALNGIENKVNIPSVSIFPNPAGQSVTVGANFAEPCLATIEIVNTLGQTVKSLSPEKVTGAFSKTIQVGDLAKGIYYIKITAGDAQETYKFEKE